MDIQASLQDLKLNLGFNPSLLGLYHSLAEAQKTILARKALEQQIRLLTPTQPYIPLQDQLVMQTRINSLNNYLRNARRLASAPEFNKLPVLQIQKEESLDCQKLKLNNQDSKLSVETTDSDSHASDIGTKEKSTRSMTKENCLKKKEKVKDSPEEPFDSKKKRNYWLPHEDQMLVNLIELHGAKWTKIASFLQNRTGKQVRDRYLNYLKPSIKQRGWTAEEDKLLHQLYEEFGNKWSRIAASLPGRTENQVKNRYYSGVRKAKSVKKPETNEPLKIVKMDPEFEHSLTSNMLSETVSNADNLQDAKNEDFETCDLSSEASVEKLGKIDQSMESDRTKIEEQTTSGSKRLCPYLQEGLALPLANEQQSNLIQHLLRPKFNANTTSMIKTESQLDGPTKKVKTENKSEDNTITIKQEII